MKMTPKNFDFFALLVHNSEALKKLFKVSETLKQNLSGDALVEAFLVLSISLQVLEPYILLGESSRQYSDFVFLQKQCEDATETAIFVELINSENLKVNGLKNV